jgi:hypothetical protein
VDKARARIEEQKQTALANIKKNKDAALKQLDIQYATADKAKMSFGYIGIAFLTVLFGSVFGNDLVKIFAHYFNRLREWWRQRRNMNDQREIERDEAEQEQVQLELDQEYADNLEESLARVYLRLVQASANNR